MASWIMSEQVGRFDDQKNKIQVTALSVAVALHLMVGFGLTQLKMHQMPVLPKPEPIAVELLNMLESEVPSEPIATPVPQPVQQPTPKTKPPTPKPIAKPIKKEVPKPVPVEPKKTPTPVQQEKPTPKPVVEEVLVKQPEVQKIVAVEAQKQAQMQIAQQEEAKRAAEEAEKVARAKAEQEAAEAKARAEAEALAAAQAKAAKEAQERAEAQARAEAEAKAQAAAKAEAAKNSAPISINVTAASWRSKPNLHFDAEEAAEFHPKTTNITVTFNFDTQGKISNIQMSSTGDSRLDRQIKTRIARAILHPQKENGVARTGKATANLQIVL